MNQESNKTVGLETKAVFLRRLGTFSVGPIVGAAIGFITVPITTRLVQPDVYGQLSMFTTATSLASMFILLGVDQAYVRDYSAATDRKKLWYSALRFSRRRRTDSVPKRAKTLGISPRDTDVHVS